jgi:hypothetical protein
VRACAGSKTDKVKLDNAGKNDFERGKRDVFNVRGERGGGRG